jgi:phenylalanyl-tRNA synthetase beta chain
MKLSESWLREWVDPPLSTDALARRLTMAGLEVDSVEPVAAPLPNVVVADVRVVRPHPEADRLSVCQVFDGEQELQVVCGAPNVRSGMKAALARVGAILPGGQKIVQTRLRGQASAGMLVSAAEIGLGDDDAGIIELSPELVAGTDLSHALALDDHSIDVELTPNRGDCLSVRGIARELGVLTRLPVRAPPCDPVPAACDATFPVRVDDPAGCPRYIGRVIHNVDVTRPSPVWLTERLRRSGLRSIDPVVDVTNYVMLELGQPLHAFDLDVLAQEVVVRRARPGETIELLDGRTVVLDAQTLLITDQDGPVAIAGVMGGERSGIQPGTRDVFLECAFFAPRMIAGTARRYGLQTDASQRFERGVDPRLQHQAIERATRLLIDIVGGEPGPVSEVVSAPELPVAPLVRLRARRLHQLTGMYVHADEVRDILTRLELAIEDEAPDADGELVWLARPPSHRFDIAIEEDLVEEICRVRGYGEIPVRVPQTRLELRRVPAEATPRTRIKQRLVDLGYQEAITYSFIDPKFQDLLDPAAPAIALTNPMSSDQSVMRTTLLPGLIRALQGNLNRQQSRVRLFELGRCFRPGQALDQRWMLAGVLCGTRLPENWSHPADKVDFFDVKGDVEALLAFCGQAVQFEAVRDPVLHPGQAARVHIADAPVGRLGRLHPELQQTLDLPTPIYLFELDVGAIEQRALPAHREVSRFPSVRRDLSLLLPAVAAAAQVESLLRKTLGDVLTEFRAFDLYEGEGIDSSEKSLAVGLTFQDPSRTLAESDINQLVDSAVRVLREEIGARLR